MSPRDPRPGPTRPSAPSPGADDGDDDLPKLIARLAEAEAALEGSVGAQMDTAVAGAGYSYLLHEAQMALVLSEARARDDAALLEAVIRSAPDLVVYVAADGIVHWINRPLSALPADKVVGKHWLAHVPEDQRAPMEQVFRHVLETGEPGSLDGPGQIESSGLGWRSRRFGPVKRGEGVVGVVIASRDLTEVKNAEMQLMVSDRMASLGTLAAGMAHEINNPLAAVMGNLEVMLESIKGTSRHEASKEELIDILQDALTAAGRIRFVVRDLKMFSRSPGDAGPDAAVNVERVIDSALRMATSETRHRARVELAYEHVAPVVGNETRLGQVFLNLIVNAAQALPAGNVEENTIRISTFDAIPDRVVVKISDTGPGIPPEVQKRLFAPFFTTKPVGIGTGLGLSICRRIIASMGGEIWFDSKVGRGTDFFVSLPRAEGLVREEERAIVPTAPVRRGRILVIDDDELVGDSTAKILAGDHDVVTVTSAAPALRALAAGERFDVILCDLMMPQMTGMDFYAAVLKLDAVAARSVIFMTGGAFTPAASRFLAGATNRHIEKPFELAQLRALVNQLVH
jgi:signal transduction histidine kinase